MIKLNLYDSLNESSSLGPYNLMFASESMNNLGRIRILGNVGGISLGIDIEILVVNTRNNLTLCLLPTDQDVSA